jgi:hypothetical protein
MKRAILAFFAGLVAWVAVVTVLNFGLRATIEGYAAAEPKLAFTLGMMVARLSMAAVTSVIAGAVVGWIAGSRTRASWALGLFILAAFIPGHVRIWHMLPVWFHLTFLVTLVPLVVLGARLTRMPPKAQVPGVAPPPEGRMMSP